MTQSYTPRQIADGLLAGEFTRNSAFVPLAEVERLREALKFYAHEYCELGEAFEGCGKLPVEQCGGCLAREALEAKP